MVMKRITRHVSIIGLILVVLLSFFLTACETDSIDTPLSNWKSKYDMSTFGILDEDNPFCEIKLSTGDSIRLELYKNAAPKSVENFCKLANNGFYDGIVFHRIIAGFMIQTGGFELKQNAIIHKESPYGTIKGEFKENGVENTIKHKEGVISMARASDNNSGSSQFFICSNDCRDSLDGKYAAFGRVIDQESMDVVVELSKIKTTNSYLYYGNTPVYSYDVPTTIIQITSIKIYNWKS